ncbi:hypothetical protein D9619_012845 [Psilocybe cf. subviscida]|uniref:BCAS3 WD40 domain-containing protein n=1 Tax=Psilocybe cf. subviscida TaxID=2480587 RepID=A0A8H5ER16_9AGAR|nr:hypothetical protein D9619_012845 [Psilocybe cf. subviscida]
MSFFSAFISRLVEQPLSASSISPFSSPSTSPSPSPPPVPRFPAPLKALPYVPYSPKRHRSSAASASTNTSNTSPSGSGTFEHGSGSGSLSRTIRGYPYAPRGTGTTSPPLVSRPVVSAVSAVSGMGGMSVGRALFGDQREEAPRAYGQTGYSSGYGQGYGSPYQREPQAPAREYRERQAQYLPHEEYHESPFEMDLDQQHSYQPPLQRQSQPAYYAQNDRQQHRAGSIPMPRTTPSMTSPVPVPMRAPISPVPASISPSSPTSYGSTSPRGGHPASGLAQAMRRGAASAASAAASVSSHVRSASQSHSRSPVPDSNHEAVISWARWDVLNGKRVLLIAYDGAGGVIVGANPSPPATTAGSGGGARLQIWDTSNLSSVTELLDIEFDKGELGMALVGDSSSNAGVRVVHAAVLPESRGSVGNVGFEAARPLLGIFTESADEDELALEDPRSTFVIYSLHTHQVVKLLSFAGRAHMFVAGPEVVVVSTALPPTLHILSARTFHTLHTIGASMLEAHATPPPLPVVQSYSPALNSTINSINAIVPSSAISISHAISQSASTHIFNIHNTVSSSNKSVLLPGLSIDGNGNSSTYDDNINTSLSAHSGGTGGSSPIDQRPTPAHPVFALQGRLLAYASPSPASQDHLPSLLPTAGSTSSKAAKRLSSSSSGSHVSSPSLSSSPFGMGGLNKLTTITQTDVGNAALKVGESVFSGMRFLGGKAFEAAKSRVVPPAPSLGPTPEGRLGAYSPGGTVGGGGVGTSKSAPDNPGVEEARERLRKERRHSNSSSMAATPLGDAGVVGGSPSGTQYLTGVAPHTRSIAEQGHYVTVLDLAGLVAAERKQPGDNDGDGPRRRTAPKKIDEFLVSRSQPIVELRFAVDATSVAAALKNGHTTRVFKLHPMPAVVLAAQAMSSASMSNERIEATSLVETAARKASQMYELHRGRTGAIVEAMEWAKDGRWFGVATRNRTVHVFGVNPYGGKTDIRSHLEGKVRNVEVTEPPFTTLSPVARLRGLKNASTETSCAPLAFVFLTPSDLALSPDLQFPFTSPTINITNSPTFSPPKRRRGTNYQDVLVFDPADGVLSLRRLTLEKRAVRDQSVVHAVTSISLPGMGGAGRLSSSPSNRTAFAGGPAEPQLELVARENVQATWTLRRGRAGPEVKISVEAHQASYHERRSNAFGGDWLAQGEITTCSLSTRILPRTLYLSHQFSFHSLGEDYHALIRRYQFDISGPAIEVRKAVEISAYSSGGGESSFVEGFSSPRDIRRASSSFDEPIASAISGSFDSSNLPVILPMYPNGVPGSTKPKSFRNSIPIRTMAGIGDGVSEGIGRLRREMTKTRSPQMLARTESGLSGPVPLEFDEEDEDFLPRDASGVPPNDEHPFSVPREPFRDNASAEAGVGSVLVTPSHSVTQRFMDADVVGTMEEDIGFAEWDPQDRLAIEEAEQFDDITAANFGEDEPKYQPPVDIPAVSKQKSRQKRR